AGLALDVEQGLEPLMSALLQVVERDVVFFIKPMRRNAFLGDVVHVARAELEFDRGAVRTDQRCVQRLIAIELEYGDVILELSGYRPVKLVQRTQSQVAFGQGMNDYTEAIDIEHFGK